MTSHQFFVNINMAILHNLASEFIFERSHGIYIALNVPGNLEKLVIVPGCLCRKDADNPIFVRKAAKSPDLVQKSLCRERCCQLDNAPPCWSDQDDSVNTWSSHRWLGCSDIRLRSRHRWYICGRRRLGSSHRWYSCDRRSLGSSHRWYYCDRWCLGSRLYCHLSSISQSSGGMACRNGTLRNSVTDFQKGRSILTLNGG